MNNQEPLHVVGLYSERVKRIKVVTIHPPATGLVKIAGDNGAGKSSLLDSIVMALGGKTAQPELPIQQGASHAKIVLDLGELRVTRTFTEKETYLTVERKGEKGKLAKPQDLLDSLIGAGLGFDPLDFVEHLKPAQQVNMLLDLLNLQEDPRVLDEQKKRLYDDRTLVNRDVKMLEVQLAGLPEPSGDIPDAEVSVRELADEHRRLVGIHHENDRVRELAARATKDREVAEREVARLRAELVKAEAALTTLQDKERQGQALVAHLQDPDLTAITEQMQFAEALNASVRQKQARQDVATQLLAKQLGSADLTDAITAIEEKKRQLLATAAFPVPDLGFEEIRGEYHVTYQSVPLEQCAKSEKIRIGLAIAMALNPTVRVILLRDGSLLDERMRAMVETLVLERGYQLWLELVGPGDDASFVIEDGGVLRAPTHPEQAAFSW